MGTTEAPHCFFHANRGKLNLSKYLKALYFRMMKELLANTTKRWFAFKMTNGQGLRYKNHLRWTTKATVWRTFFKAHRKTWTIDSTFSKKNLTNHKEATFLSFWTIFTLPNWKTLNQGSRGREVMAGGWGSNPSTSRQPLTSGRLKQTPRNIPCPSVSLMP